MGDLSHLERMGSELKCPICLGLLDSAVSLTCNHAFCRSCIMKSMKSGSTCPVSKVPFRRREVRPAPHMDSLVSIYKNMEVASGINIFVSQGATLTKFSEKEKPAEGEGNHGEQDGGGNCQDTAVKWNTSSTLKGKGSRKESKSNMKNTSSTSVKPSFPAKKRVQVPKCSFSETPTRHAIFEGETNEIAREEPKTSSTISNDKPILNDTGEPVLAPFFWLREDDDEEKSSQHTEEDQFIDLPPISAPAFSDIKDSDDEYPSNSTPTGVLHGKCSSVADLFDSEMFEWTQRPCSPELCSSPFKLQIGNEKQVSHVEEINGIQERELETALQDVTRNEEPSPKNAERRNSIEGSGTSNVLLTNLSTLGTERSNDKIGSNESSRSGKMRKTSERGKKKCPEWHTDPGFEIYIDLNKASENFLQEQASEVSVSLDKSSRRIKKSNIGTGLIKPTPKKFRAVSAGTETLDQGKENTVTEISPHLGKKEGSKEVFASKKAGKRFKKVDCLERSQKRKLDSANNNVLKEIVEAQKQKENDTNPEVEPLSTAVIDHESDFRKKRKPEKETKSCCQELKGWKKSKVSSDGKNIQEGHTYVPATETKLNEKDQAKSDVKVHDDSSVVQNLPSLMNKGVLRKCQTIADKFQCAFCLSSEESEATGEMVHYCNGRPVAADHNGGDKIIHSHRNCTEWAPNVYFHDDNAINLEAELTRSRRIKCCCCGNKGAALGCYEKSCRRSFHVPCAKLIPQCRWDTDNFVMLCPLHASSKLPTEGPQEKRKKRSPKEQLYKVDNIKIKTDVTAGGNLKFRASSKKLVLCCSALTTAEREIVSDFERLSGVTVLRNWDSSVTHVIASTNENAACRRTLKILLGILEGKWILSMEWIRTCLKVMELVDEKPYEITVDIYGIRDGPRLGRLRLLNKQPKLFDGCEFYLMGDFLPAYKGYLQDLVVAAGGTILHRKPIPGYQRTLSSGSSTRQTFIIYSLELPDNCDLSKKTTIFNRRRLDAEALATSTGAKVASNSWVLNSIAAYNLQNLDE